MISRVVYLEGLHPSHIGCSLLAIDCLNEQSITSLNPISILRIAQVRYYSVLLNQMEVNIIFVISEIIYVAIFYKWIHNG